MPQDERVWAPKFRTCRNGQGRFKLNDGLGWFFSKNGESSFWSPDTELRDLSLAAALSTTRCVGSLIAGLDESVKQAEISRGPRPRMTLRYRRCCCSVRVGQPRVRPITTPPAARMMITGKHLVNLLWYSCRKQATARSEMLGLSMPRNLSVWL